MKEEQSSSSKPNSVRISALRKQGRLTKESPSFSGYLPDGAEIKENLQLQSPVPFPEGMRSLIAINEKYNLQYSDEIIYMQGVRFCIQESRNDELFDEYEKPEMA